MDVDKERLRPLQQIVKQMPVSQPTKRYIDALESVAYNYKNPMKRATVERRRRNDN
jgi:hypothetical protein